MTENLPRKITLEEIQVGDMIRVACRSGAGADTVTRTARVGSVSSRTISTMEGWSIINYKATGTVILLDRPAPRMDEPTRIGSVVVAKVGDGEEQLFVLRPGDGDTGFWVHAHGYGYRWRDLTDPRPATEREIEEGRVIEP